MRVKAEIWVKALIRRASTVNVPAMVVRRGDADAGTVYVKVNRLDGFADLYAPGWNMEGERVWRLASDAQADEATADAYLRRQADIDPDFWVVEIEDKEGRHFLTEPVEEGRPS